MGLQPPASPKFEMTVGDAKSINENVDGGRPSEPIYATAPKDKATQGARPWRCLPTAARQ